MSTTQRTLTDSQRKQLRILKAVYDDPAITGFWNGEDCDALVSIGFAERHQVQSIWIVSITPEGVKAAEALNA